MLNDSFGSRVAKGLKTAWLGRSIAFTPTVSSTNDVAREAALRGEREGFAALAERQTMGRGRLGRPWYAPRGSILLSLLLRPKIPPAQIFSLTMLAGSAVAAGVERATGVACDLKWPNDVLVGGKKLGGILTEASLGSDGIEFAVVGLGLNVNLDFAGQPELAKKATSLSLELGKRVSRLPLLRRILEEIERRYEVLQSGDYERIHGEWRSRLSTLGKEVTVTDGSWSETGLAHDVDLDGALILRCQDNTLLRVITGDVSLREMKGGDEE